MSLSSDFTDIVVLPRNTASSTIQYFATYQTKENVVVKAHFKLADEAKFKSDLFNLFGQVKGGKIADECLAKYYSNYYKELYGLEYETEIYREVIKQIVAEKMSPNFVEYITNRTVDFVTFCDVFHKGQFSFQTTDDKINALRTFLGFVEYDSLFAVDKYKVDRKQLIDCYLNNISVSFLTLKRVVGVENKLASLITKSELTSEEVKQIMFQLLFALYLMQKLKLQHNDLHANNVLVEDLIHPRSISYTVDGQEYIVTTKYLLRIYDWDIAFMDDPYFGENLKVEQQYLKSIFVENKFKRNFDFFTIMCYLLRTCEGLDSTYQQIFSFCRTRLFKELFSDMINKGLFKIDSHGNITGWKVGGTLILSQYTNFDCRSNNEAALSQMTDLKVLLTHRVFDDFRQQIGNFQSFLTKIRAKFSPKPYYTTSKLANPSIKFPMKSFKHSKSRTTTTTTVATKPVNTKKVTIDLTTPSPKKEVKTIVDLTTLVTPKTKRSKRKQPDHSTNRRSKRTKV